jgi:hypothetical protein
VQAYRRIGLHSILMMFHYGEVGTNYDSRYHSALHACLVSSAEFSMIYDDSAITCGEPWLLGASKCLRDAESTLRMPL